MADRMEDGSPPSHRTWPRIENQGSASSLIKGPPIPTKKFHKRDGGDDDDATKSLERSLKRVRLSCSSPGELCVQRDLKCMVKDSWKRIDECFYEHHDGSCTLLLAGESPTRLVVEMHVMGDTYAQFELAIPRLYPHEPPVISQIAYSDQSDCGVQSPHELVYIREILIASQPMDGQGEAQEQPAAQGTAQELSPGTIILSNWSPITQLGHLLHDIIHVIRRTPAGAATAVDTWSRTSSTSTTALSDLVHESDSDSIMDERIDVEGLEGIVERRQQESTYSEADRATERPLGIPSLSSDDVSYVDVSLLETT